jgi:NAD-dependent dihydropyrimidine dehydrogenase PreA subunit
MTTNQTAERPRIVLCNCVHYEIIPPASKERILAALSQAGLPVEVVDDLCGLAAHRDPRLQDWRAAPSLAIVACFPRAIRWLFHAAGAPLSDGQVRLFNMRTQSPEDILGALLIEKKSVSSASPNHQSSIINQESSWVPWFPMIDYDRCANCKQCLNFCLFGVYQLSEAGQVQVRNPAGCKTNCPACARMCPQEAIIFPKYGEPPINGDEVPSESMKDNGLSMIEGGAAPSSEDLYDRIRRRSAGQKRFSTGAQGPLSGRSCPTLEGLRRELGIPESVLTSLSPAELQRITAQKGQKPASSDPRPEDGGKDKEHNG